MTGGPRPPPTRDSRLPRHSPSPRPRPRPPRLHPPSPRTPNPAPGKTAPNPAPALAPGNPAPPPSPHAPSTMLPIGADEPSPAPADPRKPRRTLQTLTLAPPTCRGSMSMDEGRRQAELIAQFFAQAAALLSAPQLAALVLEATSHPALFAFSELLTLPALTKLTGTQYASSLDLLRLFAYGTLNDYKKKELEAELANMSGFAKPTRKISLISFSCCNRSVCGCFEAHALLQMEDIHASVSELQYYTSVQPSIRTPSQNGLLDMKKARILTLNASYFLKNNGHFVISIKANCIDCTLPAEAVFAVEVEKLKAHQFKPAEQVTLEPYEHDLTTS